MSTGSCMCNAVRYEYQGEPDVTALCHCIDCQKWSGAAYTSNVVVQRKAFKVTQGEPKSYAVTGASGKKNNHWFCGDCGSGLYTELEIMPDQTCIKSGSIDDRSVRDYSVGVEFYTQDRMKYCQAVKDAKQVPQFG
ncbi:probable DUF636 domain protein [Rhynchosporium secalis]|uniref:Probable DUF636 domain protein n=1 Tax=Rhynchosporium secalis TaxID=38038 RepID=A0A1E1MHR3_RHYSE|nr:probable DUF636 domain protein [Rhynchosporium secalis]